MFSVHNITKIPSIVSTVDKYVETDMTTVTALKAVRSFNILSDNKIRSGMLYGDFMTRRPAPAIGWRSGPTLKSP